jgi:hypothetical protein
MVDFSAPYFPAEQSIVVPADSKVTSGGAEKREGRRGELQHRRYRGF